VKSASERRGDSAWRLILALGLVATACSTTGEFAPSATVTTLQPVWPQYFTLDWSVEPESTGSRRITGYVYNTNGRSAERIQILAQALDASGSVIGQQIAWVTNVVPPHGRDSFRVNRLPIAAAYRVSVWNFEFRQRR
jgi:hypothetical protein